MQSRIRYRASNPSVDEWHEEYGDALFFVLNDEGYTPEVTSPICSSWDENFTHFIPLPLFFRCDPYYRNGCIENGINPNGSQPTVKWEATLSETEKALLATKMDIQSIDTYDSDEDGPALAFTLPIEESPFVIETGEDKHNATHWMKLPDALRLTTQFEALFKRSGITDKERL